MGAADKSTFDPLDLEIIDRVYEAAWAKLIARAPVKDGDDEASRQKNLRQRLFALSQPGRVGFDASWNRQTRQHLHLGQFSPPPLGVARWGR